MSFAKSAVQTLVPTQALMMTTHALGCISVWPIPQGNAHHTKVLLYTAPWKKRTPWSAVGALGGTSGRLRASQWCTSAMSKLPAKQSGSKTLLTRPSFSLNAVVSAGAKLVPAAFSVTGAENTLTSRELQVPLQSFPWHTSFFRKYFYLFLLTLPRKMLTTGAGLSPHL